jgi:hypothetical protein
VKIPIPHPMRIERWYGFRRRSVAAVEEGVA